MTKKKIMIPIMSIMLVTSSMTAIPSLTSVYAAQAVQEAYTYQVGTQEGKQYIVLTDYKGSEEKITIPDQINGIEVKSIEGWRSYTTVFDWNISWSDPWRYTWTTTNVMCSTRICSSLWKRNKYIDRTDHDWIRSVWRS